MRYLVLFSVLVGFAAGDVYLDIETRGIGYGVTSGQNPGLIFHQGFIFGFSPKGDFRYYAATNSPLDSLFVNFSKPGYVYYAEAGLSLKLFRDNIVFGVGMTERFQGFNHVAQASIFGSLLGLIFPNNPIVDAITSLTALSAYLWDFSEHLNKKDEVSLRFGGPAFFIETGILGFGDWKLGVGASRMWYKNEEHINARVILYRSY